MEEINLTEKLKQLEAEVENEIRIKNVTTQKIWDEMTGNIIPSSPVNTASPANTAPEHSEPAHTVTLEDLNAPVITGADFARDEKWALTLAGGGGKGSYQIGVWKALREINLEKNLIAVSGSSVGALNAALISLGDYERAEIIWKNIMPKQFLDINFSTLTGPLSGIVKRSLIDGLCSRDGLIDIIDNHLDISK
ncbi:MAG: patatin-like phospholipase family protein, partial [Lachnospiraceae bacterium]